MSGKAAGRVALREYIEAILDEQNRAQVIAGEEREKAAQALATEREKVAQALAVSLAHRIDQGDSNLREHIDQQIQQIRAALVSADQLEIARVLAVSERIEAVNSEASQHVEQLRREREIVTGAQMQAISKADDATEKRFESVNEFREQLAAQTSTFLPREVADATFDEIRKQVAAVAARQDRADGGSVERRQTIQGLSTQAQLMLGVVAVIVTVLVANGVFG